MGEASHPEVANRVKAELLIPGPTPDSHHSLHERKLVTSSMQVRLFMQVSLCLG